MLENLNVDKRCSYCIEKSYDIWGGCTVCEDRIISLEELIEKCEVEDREFALWEEGKKWLAGYKAYDYEEMYLYPVGRGNTPRDAVSRLLIIMK